MHQRLAPITLLLFAIIFNSVELAAADPVTAHVIMPAPLSLDPVSLGRLDQSARTIAENLWVGLTRYNPATRQIEPGLASEWSSKDNGVTWTFKLRGDVKWVSYNPGSGQVQALRPVVAGDFVYGIRRACEPTPPNPAAHTVFIIAGCRKVATADPASIDDIFIARELGVTSVDDQTLEIKLAFADPHFDILVSLPEFRAVPREAIAKGNDWTRPDTIVTDGPWALVDRATDSMTLIRNPLWPSASTGNVERVMLTFNASSDAITQQIGAGSADFAVLDPATAATIQQSKPDVVQSTPGQVVTVLGFSIERPIVNKQAFRRALSQAIDRSDLVKTAFPGAALPMSRFTPPGAIGGPTAPPDNSGFNAESARAALLEAGNTNCRLPDKLTLVVEDQPQSLAVANKLLAAWRNVLNCSGDLFTLYKGNAATVQSVAHGTINSNSPNTDLRPELWIYSWTPDYPDANAWTGDALHCQYGFMRTAIPCGDADALIDKAFTEVDAATRQDEYTQAETMWFGEQGTFPVAPLYVSLDFVAQQPWLKGATVHGPLRFDLWSLSAH